MKIDLNAPQSRALQIFLDEFSEESKKGMVIYQAENKNIYITVYMEKENKSIVIKTTGSVFPYYVDINMSKRNEKSTADFLEKMEKFRGGMNLEEFVNKNNISK